MDFVEAAPKRIQMDSEGVVERGAETKEALNEWVPDFMADSPTGKLNSGGGPSHALMGDDDAGHNP